MLNQAIIVGKLLNVEEAVEKNITFAVSATLNGCECAFICTVQRYRSEKEQPADRLAAIKPGDRVIVTGRLHLQKQEGGPNLVLVDVIDVTSVETDQCTIALAGRLGSDPELKQFESGNTVAEVSLAVDRIGHETPSWFRVKAWSKTGEIMERYLGKGAKTSIAGRFEPREYQGNDGETRRIYEVTARDLELPPKNEGRAAPSTPDTEAYDF